VPILVVDESMLKAPLQQLVLDGVHGSIETEVENTGTERVKRIPTDITENPFIRGIDIPVITGVVIFARNEVVWNSWR
jgi:hypothetical protein